MFVIQGVTSSVKHQGVLLQVIKACVIRILCIVIAIVFGLLTSKHTPIITAGYLHVYNTAALSALLCIQ